MPAADRGEEIGEGDDVLGDVTAEVVRIPRCRGPFFPPPDGDDWVKVQSAWIRPLLCVPEKKRPWKTKKNFSRPKSC